MLEELILIMMGVTQSDVDHAVVITRNVEDGHVDTKVPCDERDIVENLPKGGCGADDTVLFPPLGFSVILRGADVCHWGNEWEEQGELHKEGAHLEVVYFDVSVVVG